MDRRRLRNRTGLAAAALASLGAALLLPGGAASQATVPRVTSSVELSLVSVDVVVTGKDGRPVEGLTAADFIVHHGKKPVEITNFREERPAPARAVPSPAAAPAASPAPSSAPPPAADEPATTEAPRVRRHVVLFVDHLALPDQREREQVFGALKRLVRTTVQPGDGVMVVSWKYGVRTSWPFTDDVALLEREIDAVAEGANRLDHRSQDDLALFAATEAFSVWAGVPPDTRLSRNLSVEEAWNEFKGKASALKGLVATMAGLEGRKVLVIASRSFSRRPGVEFSGTRVDTGPLLDEIAARANAAGVTIHSLYAAAWESEMPNVSDSRFVNPRIAGSSTTAQADNRRLNELASLDVISSRTGGVLVGTTMESSLFADRVAGDLVHWYSVGYPVPAGAPASAEVSVRVNRPGVSVRTRREVVERSADQRIEDRLLANLFRADPNARLPIAVSTGEPKKEKKKLWVATALVRVPVKHLVLVPGSDGHRGAVSVFWVSAGPTGLFSDVRRERHEVLLPADSAGPSSTTVLSWESRIESTDPTARVSIAVWDEVGGEAGFRVLAPAVR